MTILNFLTFLGFCHNLFLVILEKPKMTGKHRHPCLFSDVTQISKLVLLSLGSDKSLSYTGHV